MASISYANDLTQATLRWKHRVIEASTGQDGLPARQASAKNRRRSKMPNVIPIPSGHTQIKTYLIRLDQETEFLQFLETTVREFLAANGVSQASFFTSKQNGALMLVATLDNDPTDWNEITGFSTFLLPNGLVDFTAQPQSGLP
jgi:hypothetical protein